MVAEVEHHQLETLPQRPPERQVAVGGEAVSVGEEDPHAVAVAVMADPDQRAVIHDEIEYAVRHRWIERHFYS